MAANVRPRDRSAIRARGGGSGIAGLASFAPDFFNNPTLVDPKTGLAISLTRATTATYTDQDLIVRTALAGQARMQGMRVVRNLCDGSTSTCAGGLWQSSQSGAPLVITTGQTDPLGGTSAMLVDAPVLADALNGFAVRQSATATVTGTYVNRLTIKAKTAGDVGKTVAMYYNGSGLAGLLNATLTAGWVTYSCNPTALTAGGNNVGLAFAMLGSSYGGTNQTATSFYVYAPQVENVTGQSIQTPGEFQSVGVLSSPYQGLGVDGAKAYTTTNGNTVASNVVTEAAGTTISSSIRQGFLVELAATNLCLQSEVLGTTWSAGDVTVGNNIYVSPDGATTTDRVRCNATNAAHYITQTFTHTAAARTFSGYARYVNNRWAALTLYDGTTTYAASFDLLNGVVGALAAGTTSKIAATGTAGVYRISMTCTPLAAAGNCSFALNNADVAGLATWNAAGTEDAGFWGAQLETGSVATSYIPTTTVAVPRNADVATIATGSWYNALAGTLYAEWNNPASAASQAVAVINDGTASNMLNMFLINQTTPLIQVVTTTVSQASLSASVLSASAVAKCAVIYATNDIAGYGNNASIGTDSSATIPTVTTLNIGSYPGGILQLNSTIRAIRYYPVRLNNVTAQNLTV